MTDTDKPTLLRWWCLNCQVEHTDTMPLHEACQAASDLLAEGTPYALLYDAVHWAMYQADKAEDEARCVAELKAADPPKGFLQRALDAFRKSPQG
jgi:hypothetical protein